MHLLIATTGVLPPGPVADIAARLLDETGRVSVVTVVPAPRDFLDTLEMELWRPLSDMPPDEENEKQRIVRYVQERGERLAAPLLTALASRGIQPQRLFLEGTDPAQVICETAQQVGATMVLLGATRKIFSDGAWRSVSAEVMETIKVPLIVVPPPEETADS